MREQKKSDVTVTLKCNNNCIFCPRTTLSHIALKTEESFYTRCQIIRNYSDSIVLSGGEVTILNNFLQLVATCNKFGFKKIGLITNGRRFSDLEFAKEAIQSGITEICITLYDLRSEVHDKITRVTGSLKETLLGIENIKKLITNGDFPQICLRINTVLSSLNSDGIVSLIKEMANPPVSGVLIADAILSDFFNEPLCYGKVLSILKEIIGESLYRNCSIVLRGFPLCIYGNTKEIIIGGDSSLHGIVAEVQDIDTIFAYEDEKTRYFFEFFSNFVKLKRCNDCIFLDRCPGVQKRYIERFGEHEFRPVNMLFGEKKDHEKVQIGLVDKEKDNIENLIREEEEPSRIEVIPTMNCQLRCSYCMVKLSRKNCSMDVLYKTLEILLAYNAPEVELQFFGGEPLLQFENVRKTILKGEKLARTCSKKILFTITTNGLLLGREVLNFLKDHNVRILYSMDGDFQTQNCCRFKGINNPEKLQLLLEKNLELLMKSGIPYFVNMVVVPETVDNMIRNFEYFQKMGINTIQICYAGGIKWDSESIERFCNYVSIIAEICVSQSRAKKSAPWLQNIGSGVEPSILSTEIIVDTDGTIYGDAAIFMEKSLPGLRIPYRIGRVGEITSLEGKRKTKRKNLELLMSFYPEGSPTRQMIESQLELGLRVDRTISKYEKQIGKYSNLSADTIAVRATREKIKSDDFNPLLNRFLKRGFHDQIKFIEKYGLVTRLPVIHLENECFHDCIFCKRKKLEPTPIETVMKYLNESDFRLSNRIGLIGNEPLAHPMILKILSLVREKGFTQIEVLTSGWPLFDESFVIELIEAGVTMYSIPIYSTDPQLHDYITSTQNSFKRTIKGIENILKNGGKVYVHSNLLKQNIGNISKLEQMVTGSMNIHFCVIPVRPKTSNLPYFLCAPSYGEMVKELQGKIKSLVGFPLCVLNRIQNPPRISSDTISDLLKIYLLDQAYIKPEKFCGRCRNKKYCTGTYEGHLTAYPDDTSFLSDSSS